MHLVGRGGDVRARAEVQHLQRATLLPLLLRLASRPLWVPKVGVADPQVLEAGKPQEGGKTKLRAEERVAWYVVVAHDDGHVRAVELGRVLRRAGDAREGELFQEREGERQGDCESF